MMSMKSQSQSLEHVKPITKAASPARVPVSNTAMAAEAKGGAAVEEDSFLASAASDLGKKLGVVPDDLNGPNLPGVLHQTAFDEAVNTYSAIGQDKTNLHFDGSDLPDAARKGFKGRVMDDVGSLMQTPTGRELVDQLAYGTKGDGSPSSTVLRGSTNPGDAQAQPANEVDTSNGRGTDSTVTYAPGTALPDRNGPSEVTSDTLLFHEMVHANHMRKGTEEVAPVRPGAGVSTEDVLNEVYQFEHQAVGIGAHRDDALTENNYRSERRDLGKANSAPRESYTKDVDYWKVPVPESPKF